MPKYYCDYCDTYLTHDSPSVRKTHCNGRKHKENVRIYYQKWLEEQVQKLVDDTTAAFKAGKIQSNPFAGREGQAGPGGAMIPPPSNQSQDKSKSQPSSGPPSNPGVPGNMPPPPGGPMPMGGPGPMPMMGPPGPMGPMPMMGPGMRPVGPMGPMGPMGPPMMGPMGMRPMMGGPPR